MYGSFELSILFAEAANENYCTSRTTDGPDNLTENTVPQMKTLCIRVSIAKLIYGG